MKFNGQKSSYLRWSAILLSLAILAVLAGCADGGSSSNGSNDSGPVQEAVMQAQNDETWHSLQGNGDGLAARYACIFEGCAPEAQALIDGGDRSVKLISEEIASMKGSFSILDDEALVLYSFVLGEIGDRAALPVLADILESSVGTGLLLAPHAATDAIFNILDDSRRRTETFDYPLPERDEALDAAKSAMAAAQELSKALTVAANTANAKKSCQRRFTLVDDDGNPLMYTDEHGNSVPATFECTQVTGTPTLPPGAAAREERVIKEVESLGGSFVDLPQFDNGRPSSRYNCAGFSFRELSVANSLNCHAGTMLKVLTGAGVLKQKGTFESYEVGDKIFYFPQEPFLGFFNSTAEVPAHVAVVNEIVDGNARVRAPDNASGVFDADIDAPYFTSGYDDSSTDPGNRWKPYADKWADGKMPKFLSVGADTGDKRYCPEDECGGCPDDQICISGRCESKTPENSCEARGSCCFGRDDTCTAPGGATCYCDEYCLEANDCCADYPSGCP